ncbi:MAG: hypothetical protein JWM05_1890 [Acidimicrobiales bacterium]|nr:hypothetical protein [Acidimicrobiales bacterium]
MTEIRHRVMYDSVSVAPVPVGWAGGPTPLADAVTGFPLPLPLPLLQAHSNTTRVQPTSAERRDVTSNLYHAASPARSARQASASAAGVCPARCALARISSGDGWGRSLPTS